MGGLTGSPPGGSVSAPSPRRPLALIDHPHRPSSVAGIALRLALAAGVVLLALAPSGPAGAAVTCVFSGTTVQVTLGAPEDAASVVRESGGDEILVRAGGAAVPCGGTPTVDKVDAIVVVDASPGTTGFTIDLSGGPFAPGAFDEGGVADTTDEIEFHVDLGGGFPDRVTIAGSSGADDIVFSGAAANLNDGSEPAATRDFDVTTFGVEEHAVTAEAGNDIVTGQDPLLTPFGSKLILSGDAGTDVLTGGTAADDLFGGPDGDDLEGGSAADSLHGDAGPDGLAGGEGNDRLLGGGDADDLDGGSGGDRLDGGGGADLEAGGLGDDVFDQGPDANGGDAIDGGTGFDLVAYDLRSLPLRVTVGVGVDDGQVAPAEGDDIGPDIEAVLGGDDADDMTGDAQNNVLRGGSGSDEIDGAGGHDTVDGDPGNDVLTGGAGVDTVSFFGGPAVTANLATGSATGDGTDALSGFENAEGGAHADTFFGTSAANVLTGRGGGDSLLGGDGSDDLHGGEGNDTIAGEPGDDLVKGNGGSDTASFAGSPAPVAVSLGGGTATGEGSDTLTGIENALGGPAGDSLAGNDQPNVLVGGGGRDSISGLGGNDDLRGSPGDDFLDAGPGHDVLAGGDGNDALTGSSGADRFLESEQKGANGADSMTGGPGQDVVTYAGRKGRVEVTIGSRARDGQRGERDQVGGDVEEVRGTSSGDVLIGNGRKNVLSGGAGGDNLKGRGGRDRLVGGSGNDRIDGGPQPDVCKGGGGRDVLRNCGRGR
jgi:Ca2+-binding RTX toxin-like protein